MSQAPESSPGESKQIARYGIQLFILTAANVYSRASPSVLAHGTLKMFTSQSLHMWSEGCIFHG
jgi:hypothetical protein